MSSTGVLIAVILGLALVVLGVLIIIIPKLKENKEPIKVKKQAKPITIVDLVKIAENKDSTKNELSSAVLKVISSFSFPDKRGEKPPKEAQPYLDFVFFIVYNRNSDAKLIAHMAQELKKKNPTYVKEIDAYEEEGMKKRRFQPQS